MRTKERTRQRDLTAAKACAVVALGLTAVLRARGEVAFARYFGPLPSVAVVTVFGLLGLVAVHQLHRLSWIARCEQPRLGIVGGGLVATGLAALIIGVDALSPMAANLNVELPNGLLFYPAMALVAEVAFHLAPLAGIATVLALAGRTASSGVAVAVAFVVCVLIEPAFQVVAGISTTTPVWVQIYVGFHVLAISSVQLWLLRNRGFIPAIAFRAAYYVWWHIVWGHLRLELI